MRLTVLGSGSCVAEQTHRASSAYILEASNGKLLIDTGTGSLRNLVKAGFDVKDVDKVFSTHRHPDHVSDLIPLIQDKVVRSFSEDESDLEVYGPEGHRDYVFDRMRHEMVDTPEVFQEKFGFDLKVNELEASNSFEKFSLEALKALHGPGSFSCLSLKFCFENKTIVFTGDTDFNPELVEFAGDADLFVTDCSRPSDVDVEGHMNVDECAELAEKADVGKLVLSHLYPSAEEEDLKKQASQKFEGEIVVAEDLLSIDF